MGIAPTASPVAVYAGEEMKLPDEEKYECNAYIFLLVSQSELLELGLIYGQPSPFTLCRPDTFLNPQ